MKPYEAGLKAFREASQKRIIIIERKEKNAR